MTLAIRFYSPVSKALYANGRTYPITGGSYLDVPYSDAVAMQSDQAHRLMITGATSDRPGNTGAVSWPPAVMYDTTLGKPIFLVPGSNPASWIDITGASV